MKTKKPYTMRLSEDVIAIMNKQPSGTRTQFVEGLIRESAVKPPPVEGVLYRPEECWPVVPIQTPNVNR